MKLLNLYTLILFLLFAIFSISSCASDNAVEKKSTAIIDELMVKNVYAHSLLQMLEDVSELNTKISDGYPNNLVSLSHSNIEIKQLIKEVISSAKKADKSKEIPILESIKLKKIKALDCKMRRNSNCWPLESYALEQLLVVGYIKQRSDDKLEGLVQIAEGQLFRIKEGQYMGRHYGKVLNIDRESGIRLEEMIPDGRGGWVRRKVNLTYGNVYYESNRLLTHRMLYPLVETTLQREFVNASADKDVSTLSSFLDQGANLDATYEKEKFNALTTAVIYRNVTAIQWLIDQGAKLDLGFGDQGYTPLMIAANSGYLDMAKLLITRGATVDADTPEKRTALYFASEKGYLDIVKLLCDRGALPTRKTNGIAPFTIAAARDHLSIVKYYLANGLSVDSQDELGYTLLSAAAEGEALSTAHYLLSLGANPNIKTSLGKTAFEIARTKNNKELDTIFSRYRSKQ